jgi:acyl-coenzyme A thioesterase 13
MKKDTYQSPDLTMSLLDRVNALRDAISNDPDYTGFDTTALKGVELLSVDPGRTVWSLTIGPHHANKGRNLHGGCSATILDNLTSTALLTLAKPGFLDGGHVSRTITMSYLRPVPIGMKVRIECEVVAAGKSTANLYGVIKGPDGKICVTCVHDKAVFNKGTQKQQDFKPKL